MPTLVVLRHAKADRPPGVDDLDRPLLPRGRDDAAAAGAWLLTSVPPLDLVVTSPARRTLETTESLLASYGGDEPPVVPEERLYEATLGDAVAVVRGLDDEAGTVLLVGHEPWASALVRDLTGADVRMRTCGIAVVQVPAPWADAPPGGCELVTTATPRGPGGT